jgi:hypothetical protein
MTYSNIPIEPIAKREKSVTPFRIYYGSRTHAQISQVLRELKKTSYRPVMAVLGLTVLVDLLFILNSFVNEFRFQEALLYSPQREPKY